MTLNKPSIAEEDIFYRRLIEFKRSLKAIAISKLAIKTLDQMGIPNLKIKYKTTHKKYKNKNHIEKIYQYTSYFYKNSHKHFEDSQNLSSKMLYLVEAYQEVELSLQNNMHIAELYCKELNLMSSLFNINHFILQDEIAMAEDEFEASNEYLKTINNYIIVDDEIDDEKNGRINKDEVQFHNNWRETQRNTFGTNIIDLKGERYRSKNEIIAAICVDYCGLFVNMEPFYPGTNLRADFGIMCALRKQNRTQNNKNIISEKYVEILGKCGNESYDNKINEKKQIAKKQNISVLFINMTDKITQEGSTISNIDMRDIQKQLIKFYYSLQ